MVDIAGLLRRIENTEAKHGGVAKPEGEPGDEANLGDFDDAQPPGGIDPVPHRAAGKNAGADIVADRVAGKAAERGGAIRHFVAADRAQREQIVKGERQIGGGDKQPGNEERPPIGRLDRVNQFVKVDIAQNVIEHDRGDDDDGEAEDHTQSTEADFFVEEMRAGAQSFQHSALQTGCSCIDRPSRAAHPAQTAPTSRCRS